MISCKVSIDFILTGGNGVLGSGVSLMIVWVRSSSICLSFSLAISIADMGESCFAIFVGI